MDFSVGLYFLMTALVLVQCDVRYLIEDGRPHELHEIVPCGSREIRREIRWNMENVTVAPYKMLVALDAAPGYTYHPSMVWVPRCGGFCRDGLVSMPTATQMSRFTVQRTNAAQREDRTCVRVNVESHTNCRCMCPSDESMCSDKHKWNAYTCACDCKHSNIVKREEDKCRENPENMVWNNEECACECRERIMGCVTGEYWNENECRCGRA